MTKVLMVCLGNICRSPLAEGILQHKADQERLEIEVDSAGTGGWHTGESPDPRSISKALEYGIDISRQRAVKFTAAHFEEFDHIYVMDRSNYNNVVDLATSSEDREKVRMILNEANPGSNAEVPDPYYGANDGFEHVYQLLDAACDQIIDKLR